MSDEPSTPKSGKGFSGLDSLISDVSKDVQIAAEKVPARTNSIDAAPRLESKPQPSGSEAPRPAGPSNGKYLGWIAIGVVGLLAVWAIDNSSTKHPTPPAQSATAPALAPTPLPSTSSSGPRSSSVTAPSTASPAQQAPPSAPTLEYERPPVGTDHAHNVAQLRYCTREKMRLDGLESILNSRSNYEIDRFNALVVDYNSRCANYRYRRSDMERVQRELEPLRTSFISAAISEWRR